MRCTVTANELVLHFSYDEQMIAQLKKSLHHDLYYYDHETRVWRLVGTVETIEFIWELVKTNKIHLTDYDYDKLRILLTKVSGIQEQQTIFEQLSHALSAPVIPEVEARLNAKYHSTEWKPKKYQWVTPYYAQQVEGNIRIALLDPMGVGKSVQAVMATMLDKCIKHNVLIVCPANNTGTWQSELLRMFGETSWNITKPITHLIPGIRFYIVSYEQTHKIKCNEDFFLIVDEYHKVKNKDTRRYKRLTRLKKYCRHRMALTGTPVENRAMELYSLFTFLDDKFMDWHDFGHRHCNMHITNWGLDANGLTDPEGLHKMLYKKAIRREKKAVLPELPDKERRVIDLASLDIQADSIFEMYSKNAELKILNQEFWDWYTEDILMEHPKVITFFHHQIMGKALCEHYKSLGLNYIFIDGSVSGEQRDRLVDLFQTNDDIDGAILSITAASTGLTLTASDVVVFAELCFAPGTLEQAEDRIHRIGQKSACTVFKPRISKFEIFLSNLIIKKLGVIAQIIDGRIYDNKDDQSLLKSMSKEFGIKIGRKKKEELAA